MSTNTSSGHPKETESNIKETSSQQIQERAELDEHNMPPIGNEPAPAQIQHSMEAETPSRVKPRRGQRRNSIQMLQPMEAIKEETEDQIDKENLNPKK